MSMFRAGKVARADASGSALLKRAREDGFESAIDVPFTSEELGCYTAKDGASGFNAQQLVTGIRVAHFVEDALTPWATHLAAKLFDDAQPWSAVRAAWAALAPLEPLDGACAAVFRKSALSPCQKLQLAPQEWHATIFRSYVSGGALHTDDETLAACMPFAHKLAEIHTVALKTLQHAGVRCATWRALERLPTLRSLEIVCADSEDVHSEATVAPPRALGAALAAQPGLTHLHLCAHACRVDYGSVDQLQLTQLRQLQSLVFKGVCQPRVGALADAVLSMPQLTHLDLACDNEMVWCDAARFFAALAACSALCSLALHGIGNTSFELTQTEMRGWWFGSICEQLGQLPCLRGVKIESAQLYDEYMDFAVQRSDGFSKLDTLELQCDCFMSCNVAPLLRKCAALTRLSLDRNGGIMDRLDAICATIATLTCLRHLNVAISLYLKDADNEVAAMLACLPQLTYLDLTDCSLSVPDGANRTTMPPVVTAIAAMTALAFLSLSGNSWSDEDVELLAPQLSRMTHLSHLESLRTPSLSGRGRAALLQHAARLPRMRALLLLDNTACSGMGSVQPLLPHLRAMPRHINKVEQHEEGRGEGRNAALDPVWRAVDAALAARGASAAAAAAQPH